MSNDAASTTRRDRLKQGASLPAQGLRIALRDPEHVPERLLLRVTERVAVPCSKWAQRVRSDSGGISDAATREYWRTVHMARMNGAVAGTPFFIALVPAYLVFLEQEYRLFLKLAALAGRDPADLTVAADFLVMRGVHKTQAESLEALQLVKDTPAEAPTDRRPVKYWYQSVMTILVYAGFLSAPDPDGKKDSGFVARLKMLLGFAVAGVIWMLTWVFPLSFMVLMSWNCERDARNLGQASLEHWGLDATDKLTRAEKKQRRREMSWRERAFNLARGLLFVATLAVPFYLIGGAIVGGRWSLSWNVPAAAGALAAVALVIGGVVSVTWERSGGKPGQ